jgi:putative membrane protein
VTEDSTAKAAPGADQVKLALERTFLAHERTLMAWVRTATSLITFGFALYKFFMYLHQERPPTHGEELFGARTYGLCMIGFGVATLVVATLQHRQQMKTLRGQFPEAPMSLSFVLAGLMGVLGLIAFTAGLFRQ